jgi:hypothetical protein
VSGFWRDINYFIIIKKLLICASFIVNRKAGDGPSNNISIIADNSGKTDPAGGAFRRINIYLDIDIRRGENYRILLKSFQAEICDFSII